MGRKLLQFAGADKALSTRREVVSADIGRVNLGYPQVYALKEVKGRGWTIIPHAI